MRVAAREVRVAARLVRLDLFYRQLPTHKRAGFRNNEIKHDGYRLMERRRGDRVGTLFLVVHVTTDPKREGTNSTSLR
jgi:hypothetical protein